MARGYWIARVDVADPAAFQTYIELNKPVFEKFGARFIVRGGRFENPEGSSRQRNVVLEFESYAAALACYRSPEYQATLHLRTNPDVSTTDLVIIEGYDAP